MMQCLHKKMIALIMIIADVFEKGYKYREKVIRHAKVIVNKK